MNPASQQQPQQSQQQQLQQQLQLQLQLQQRLKQQTLALLQQQQQQQQQQMFQPGLLTTAMSQIEPIPSGNLPPGFDATSCRSVYVGNIHPQVTEALLAEVFATAGLMESCKLIKKEKSSYGFVDYYDHRSAVNCILTLNGQLIFGEPIKVNWAYASGQREDTAGHFHIFVGDLSAEVTDATLFAAFSIYQSCSDARVMWDQRSGRSRGFGFVSFRNKKDAETAITEMSGKWLGSRVIRCNWATKSVSGNQAEEMNNPASAGLSYDSASVDLLEVTIEGEKPESNPQYTTVYVGNLAHNVNQTELHRQFHLLGAGVIEDVRVQQDKGFGFVRYHTHEEAALAIQLANGKVIGGKSIKTSWGNKPTVPGSVSTPLPPPGPVAPFQGVLTAGLNQNFTTSDLLAYQRHLSLAQVGTGQALLPLPQQPGLGLGLAQGTAGNATAPGILDGLQQGVLMPSTSIGQQLLYYS